MNARAPGEEPGKEDNGRPGTQSFKISRTGTLGRRGPLSAGHAKSVLGLSFGPGHLHTLTYVLRTSCVLTSNLPDLREARTYSCSTRLPFT